MASIMQTAAAVALEDDADKRYELVDGQWEAKEMGSSRHSGVGTRLIIEMGMHVKLNKLGAVYGADATFQIGSRERLPDVSFLSTARTPAEGETFEKWLVAPDLAVEVISPNEVWEKVNRKVHEYFAAGVQQVWLVSLELREVHVYDSPRASKVFAEDEDLANETLLPGFRLRISELFQPPVQS